MRVIAVIPAYNEASRLEGVLARLRPFVQQIVVVDDGSADDTWGVAKRAGVTVLRHGVNRGQGAALRTGTMAALRLGADVVVHLDADGQHHPEALIDALAPIREQRADIVIGSRFLGVVPEGMPFLRRVLLGAARQFNRWTLGIPARVTDPQSGFRLLRAEAARALVFRQDRMAHASELLRVITRSSWRWVEVPVPVSYSQETLAKGQKTLDAPRIAWQLILGMFHR